MTYELCVNENESGILRVLNSGNQAMQPDINYLRSQPKLNFALDVKFLNKNIQHYNEIRFLKIFF